MPRRRLTEGRGGGADGGRQTRRRLPALRPTRRGRGPAPDFSRGGKGKAHSIRADLFVSSEERLRIPSGGQTGEGGEAVIKGEGEKNFV